MIGHINCNAFIWLIMEPIVPLSIENEGGILSPISIENEGDILSPIST